MINQKNTEVRLEVTRGTLSGKEVLTSTKRLKDLQGVFQNYGFDYTDVRAHIELAWFPLLKTDRSILWKRNLSCRQSKLTEKIPPIYSEFDVNYDRIY